MKQDLLHTIQHILLKVITEIRHNMYVKQGQKFSIRTQVEVIFKPEGL